MECVGVAFVAANGSCDNYSPIASVATEIEEMAKKAEQLEKYDETFSVWLCFEDGSREPLKTSLRIRYDISRGEFSDVLWGNKYVTPAEIGTIIWRTIYFGQYLS